MPKPFHVGVKAIVRTDGRYLILRKEKDGVSYWDLPGGRIDGSETPLETLERELTEELPDIGAHQIDHLIAAYPLPKDITPGLGLLFLTYLVAADPFEPRLSAEHAECRLLSRQQLIEMIEDSTRPLGAHTDVLQTVLEKGF